jgi:hypothetical protein
VFAGDVDARVSVFGALMRASDSDSIRQQMRTAGELTFVEPLVRLLHGPDAELRARLIGAQINGLLSALALGDNGLSTARRELLISTYGRAVQALIDKPE